jgi:serine/threonine protein kinase
VAASPSQTGVNARYWPSARHFTEAIQCPSICFSHPQLRNTLPAVDRLGMPLVTSGQFAYVYKLKSMNGGGDFAVRCFRGYLGDRDQRYRAIQEHLKTSPVLYLSDFTYAPEGILVGGQRFPILFMKWIEGPTLDLYIREMLRRPDVLLHLCEEWKRLLSALRASGIAHGDLQHGNIIVEHGQLRLVDHDGMFVTAMTGWRASEVGHQHYQHPRRDAQHFGLNLDNFSSLVIYLSLLSLAERPSLWQEHHDENLLFTKTDFVDPAASSLFAKIRELGPEHRTLADVLAEAATGSPAAAPYLLDLVKTKSSLPSWMTAPMDLDAKTRTREVVSTDSPSDRRNVRWISWQERSKATSIPSSPSSTSFQTIFAKPPAHDPDDVLRNAIYFSREYYKKNFLLWYWGAYILLTFLGLDFGLSLLFATLCLTITCLTLGLMRAIDERKKAHSGVSSSWQQQTSITGNPVRQPALPSSWSPRVTLPPPPAPILSSSEPFVGNLVLGIYHLAQCDWVTHISTKNRVAFSTASEAVSHGFKPCQICSPVA